MIKCAPVVWDLWEQGIEIGEIAYATDKTEHTVAGMVIREMLDLKPWPAIRQEERLQDVLKELDREIYKLIKHGGTCKDAQTVWYAFPAQVIRAIYRTLALKRHRKLIPARGRGASLREITKAKLIVFIKAGAFATEAARRLGINESTAQAFYRKWKRMSGTERLEITKKTGADRMYLKDGKIQVMEGEKS